MSIPKLDFQQAVVLVLISRSYLDPIWIISLTEGVGGEHTKTKAQPETSSLNGYAPARAVARLLRQPLASILSDRYKSCGKYTEKRVNKARAKCDTANLPDGYQYGDDCKRAR